MVSNAGPGRWPKSLLLQVPAPAGVALPKRFRLFALRHLPEAGRLPADVFQISFISYLLVLSRRRVLPCPRFEGMISVSSISFSLQRRRRIIPSRLIAGNATQLTFPFTS